LLFFLWFKTGEVIADILFHAQRNIVAFKRFESRITIIGENLLVRNKALLITKLDGRFIY